MRRWIIHLVMTVIGASLGVAVVPPILKVFGWGHRDFAERSC